MLYICFSAEALVSIPKKSEIPLNYMIVEVCVLLYFSLRSQFTVNG